jgi:hypothetical protein
MTAAERGERQVRIFGKVGTLIGQGNIARAIETSKGKEQLARGDLEKAERFSPQIAPANAENKPE